MCVFFFWSFCSLKKKLKRIFGYSPSPTQTSNQATKQPSNQLDAMSITIKQLQALSEEFNFDMASARSFLGHADPKKRGRPSKDSGSDSDGEKPVAKSSDSKCKSSTKVETPREKRAPTGYQLYMSDVSSKVQTDLKKAASDGTVARGAFVTEVAKRWKALDEKQREKWVKKAKQ